MRCAECGEWFKNLSIHISRAHGETVAVYRHRHGLEDDAPMVGHGTREKFSAAARAVCLSGQGRNAQRTDEEWERMLALHGWASWQDAAAWAATQGGSWAAVARLLGVTPQSVYAQVRRAKILLDPWRDEVTVRMLAAAREHVAARKRAGHDDGGLAWVGGELGRWISRRAVFMRGGARSAIDDELDQLDPDWHMPRHDARFRANAREVAAFIERHGRQPQHKSTGTEHTLYNRIDAWRAGRTLTPERRAYLDEIVPGWDAPPGPKIGYPQSPDDPKVRRARRLANEGRSVAEIANALRMSPTGTASLLKRHGIVTTAPPRPVLDANTAAWINAGMAAGGAREWARRASTIREATGATLAEIAAACGVKISTASSRIQRGKTPAVGARDGHGRYAVLDVDDDGRLLCHECGAWWEHLGTHAWGAHGLTAAQYRQTHGLGAQTRLVGAGPRERMRAAWAAHADEHTARLAAHRDPGAAYRASPAHTGADLAPQSIAGWSAQARAQAGRDLTREETARLTATGRDLQAWADVARDLLADPTITPTSLARACGIARPTAHQRLRRHPARA